MTPKLRPATIFDYPTIIRWVPDLNAARFWGGPKMTYPITVDFLEDQLRPTVDTTFVMIDERYDLLAFGQIQFREPSRFHLARLIVNPDVRGQGYGRTLVELLMAQAADLSDRFFTLNVNRNNEIAQNLYLSLGFQFAPHPLGSTFSETSLFMRKDG